MELVQGNIFIREMRFEDVGEQTIGHEHNFDHTTYVVRGGIRIEQLDAADNVVRAIEKRASDGYNWVLVKAATRHRITALEANTIAHCIYAHRTPQGDVVQEWDGWASSYV